MACGIWSSTMTFGRPVVRFEIYDEAREREVFHTRLMDEISECLANHVAFFFSFFPWDMHWVSARVCTIGIPVSVMKDPDNEGWPQAAIDPLGQPAFAVATGTRLGC